VRGTCLAHLTTQTPDMLDESWHNQVSASIQQESMRVCATFGPNISLGSHSTFTCRSTTSGSTCQWRANSPWRFSFVHLAVAASIYRKQFASCVASEWRTAGFSGDPDDAQQAAERLQARNTQCTSRLCPMLQEAPTQATQRLTRTALHHSSAASHFQAKHHMIHNWKQRLTFSAAAGVLHGSRLQTGI
jgi:hypothetical protein